MKKIIIYSTMLISLYIPSCFAINSCIEIATVLFPRSDLIIFIELLQNNSTKLNVLQNLLRHIEGPSSSQIETIIAELHTNAQDEFVFFQARDQLYKIIQDPELKKFLPIITEQIAQIKKSTEQSQLIQTQSEFEFLNHLLDFNKYNPGDTLKSQFEIDVIAISEVQLQLHQLLVLLNSFSETKIEITKETISDEELIEFFKELNLNPKISQYIQSLLKTFQYNIPVAEDETIELLPRNLILGHNDHKEGNVFKIALVKRKKITPKNNYAKFPFTVMQEIIKLTDINDIIKIFQLIDKPEFTISFFKYLTRNKKSDNYIAEFILDGKYLTEIAHGYFSQSATKDKAELLDTLIAQARSMKNTSVFRALAKSVFSKEHSSKWTNQLDKVIEFGLEFSDKQVFANLAHYVFRKQHAVKWGIQLNQIIDFAVYYTNKFNDYDITAYLAQIFLSHPNSDLPSHILASQFGRIKIIEKFVPENLYLETLHEEE